MTYELFWAGQPHTAGTGFWAVYADPFKILNRHNFGGSVPCGQVPEKPESISFKCQNLTEAFREIDNLNSQLEAYRSKQLSLNSKEGK